MPVLDTKLHLPNPRRQLVTRTRLTDALHGPPGSMPRLVLVAAPAGFGKTTLLTQWLSAQPPRAPGTAGPATPAAPVAVAWLSLDAADGDLPRFLTHVVAALQRVHSDVAAQVGKNLGSDTLALLEAARGQSAEPALVSLVNDLDTLVGPTVLALDDYHVIDTPAVHEAMTFLLDHLPAHVTVAITTRADPPLPLARLRGRGELVEVRAADLRFTVDEAGQFLNQVMGLDLDEPLVEALEARTEGWAAGLQLAAMSARTRAGSQDRQAVSEFVEAFTGSHRFVLDYLAEEVLAGVRNDVRAFLLDTCVLEQLSASLCDAVTGRDDGQQTLQELDRSNLFVVPLDDRRQWYRYHHLFGDVLQARLLAEQPERLPVLHRAACDWFAEQHLMEDAVRHALAAQDFDRAAYLMELALPDLRRTRQDRVLMGWMQSLPAAAVRGRPVLSILSAWSSMMVGDLQAMDAWLDDAEAALTAAADEPDLATAWADTDDLRTASATLWLYRAALAQARGEVEATMRHARSARELAEPDDHFVHGGASGFLGLAAWAAGDIEEALATFSDAVRSLHAAGNFVDELDATVVLADMWLTAGRPDRARELYERALATAVGHGEPYPRATADLHVGLAELDRQLGDLEAARAHLEAARVLGRSGSITENRHRWYTASAQVRASAGEHEVVDELLDQAEERYRPGSYPDVRPITALRARLHLMGGDLAAAQVWAGEHPAAAETGSAPLEFLHEYDQLTVVRVQLAQLNRNPGSANVPRDDADGDAAALDRTLRLLNRLEDAARPARAASLLEIGMLRALTLDVAGQRADALAELERALSGAPDPDGYVRLFLDEGESMLALLHAAASQRAGVPDLLGQQARRLLAAAEEDSERAEGKAAGAPNGQGVQLPDPLSEREVEVLRLLDSTLTGPQIAGQLFVSLNTFRTHTKRIFTKLDVTSRAAAVSRGRELDLL
jgi:LuxR family maltose regulon positive regulatory protein